MSDPPQIEFNARLVYPPYRGFRPPKAHPSPVHWAAIRRQALERDGHQCRLCSAAAGDEFTDHGGPVRLEVHHRHYRNFGAELVEDVTTLCERCHRNHTDAVMRERDQARVLNPRGQASTPASSLPAAPAHALNLPAVSDGNTKALPAARASALKLPIHFYPG